MKILFVGLDAHSKSVVQGQTQGIESSEIKDADAFGAMFDQPPPADLIFVGTEIESVSLLELAQGLRGQYVSAPILYIATKREGFEKKNFLKNGFTDAFLLPLDDPFLKRAIEDFTAQFKKTKS